jgi:hypothetical protein
VGAGLEGSDDGWVSLQPRIMGVVVDGQRAGRGRRASQNFFAETGAEAPSVLVSSW